MRKSRTVVTDLDEELYKSFKSDIKPLEILDALEVPSPAWASMMMLFFYHNKSKLDISFFENAQDFFLWYTKVLISIGNNVKVTSFSRNDNDGSWQIFTPPTLVGLNLITKLRDSA